VKNAAGQGRQLCRARKRGTDHHNKKDERKRHGKNKKGKTAIHASHNYTTRLLYIKHERNKAKDSEND